MAVGYISEVFTSFQGEGLPLGERHLFVRFAGCNLRCAYCDQPESLERVRTYTMWRSGGDSTTGTNPVPAPALTALVAPLFECEGPIDAVAVTGGEPLLQAGFLAEWLAAARLPVPVLLETSGGLPEALEQVIDLVDVVSMDVKLPSNSGERALWTEHAAFARIAARKRLYVKIPVDAATDESELERAAEMLAAIDETVPVFVQPIADPEGRLRAGAEDLTRFHSIARRRLRDVRVVPQAHKALGLR